MSRPALRGCRPTTSRSRRASARGRLYRLAHVTLPLIAPYLIAAFGLSFALSMGELGATVMVYPPGWVTLPVAIFGLTDRGDIFWSGADHDSGRGDLGAARGPGALAPRRRWTQSLGIIGKQLLGPRHILVNYLARHPIA